MRKEAISDQKRFVRGEHWLMTRRILRARDHLHHGKWKILTIAGPTPAEEIDCLRELMPTAVITAVDIKPENVQAAKIAGADRVLLCDVADFVVVEERYCSKKYLPAALAGEKFDAVCLDLTGPVDKWLASVVSIYWLTALTNHGVMIVTASYGRDVLEAYQETWRRASILLPGEREKKTEPLDKIAEMPEPIKARLWFLLKSKAQFLQSCLQYAGNAMPMLSCLLVKSHRLPPAEYEVVNGCDFELAVTADNIGNIYACPKERIIALRRSAAARKAVATRKARQAGQKEARLNG